MAAQGVRHPVVWGTYPQHIVGFALDPRLLSGYISWNAGYRLQQPPATEKRYPIERRKTHPAQPQSCKRGPQDARFSRIGVGRLANPEGV